MPRMRIRVIELNLIYGHSTGWRTHAHPACVWALLLRRACIGVGRYAAVACSGTACEITAAA